MLITLTAINQTKSKRYQGGNVLVLFVISLLALITLASLALDGGHLLLNKGRLQNLVDAAALHAAKELDQGATKAEASAAAINLLQINLAHTDQQELSRAINLADIDNNTAVLTIEYSVVPDPFIAVTDLSIEAQFVKVSLSQLTLDSFLANVYSFNKRVSATALAGPSTAIKNCFTNLVPMMVCGTKGEANYGLDQNDLYVMKTGANTASALGPGNFQLVRLENNTGKGDIRKAMAGEANISQTCFSTGIGNGSVPTEPGGAVGPVAQGLNTRLGEWLGSTDEHLHPRDKNICQGNKIAIEDDGTLEVTAVSKAYRASLYKSDNALGNANCSAPPSGLNINDITQSPPALAERRVMNVVIGDCTNKLNGMNEIDFLGVACFFLTQRVEQKGQESYVVGEFLYDCAGGGDATLEAVDTPGSYKMVLYHVPGSTDS